MATVPFDAYILATGYKTPGGASTQFFKADGSLDLTSYEPAFTKLTAFNKNFGSVAGTVLEGRTFGTAANSPVGDFAPFSHTHAYLPLAGGTMANTNKVINLNADLLDGLDSTAFALASHTQPLNTITGLEDALAFKAPLASPTFTGNVTVNTNGSGIIISSYKGANSIGNNSFIGGGGLSSIGAVGATYKGSYNTAQGVNALYFNTTGYYNTAQGMRALYLNTTGYYNTAQGVNALYFNTTGYYNTAQGVNALYFNTTGNQNSAQGVNALYFNTTGYYNTAQGVYAGGSIIDGNSNTFVGYGAGYHDSQLTSAINSMALGSGAYTTANNQVVIGNDSIVDTLLKGKVTLNNIQVFAQYTTATEPAYVKGAQFFNTTLNKMRIGGASAYETVTSS